MHIIWIEGKHKESKKDCLLTTAPKPPPPPPSAFPSVRVTHQSQKEQKRSAVKSSNLRPAHHPFVRPPQGLLSPLPPLPRLFVQNDTRSDGG